MRLTGMRHELSDESAYFKSVSYTYYANGWLHTIYESYPSTRPDPGDPPDETSFGSGSAAAGGGIWYGIEFEYDARGRLTRETREGNVGLGSIAFFYDLECEHDQAGNRIACIIVRAAAVASGSPIMPSV